MDTGVDSWSSRRLLAVCAGLLTVTVTTAYLASAVQSTRYAAQADVLLKVEGTSQEAERQLATQEVLLSSRGVLAPVADRFDVPLSDLTESQEVEQIAGSQILRMQIHDEDPDQAVRLTQAVADSYVASVAARTTDIGVDQEMRLRDEITELSATAAAGRARLAELAAARAAVGGVASPTQEERRLQAEDTVLAQRINGVQSELTELLVQRANAGPVEILTPAYLLDEPVSPQPRRAAAGGAILGLLLCAGLLAFATRRRWATDGA